MQSLNVTESLIAADDAAPKQLELVASPDLPAAFFAEGEASMNGEFTAARLFAQHPDKYRAVVSLVAENFPLRAIARGLRVSHNTIRQVCAREGVEIGRERAGVVSDYKALERALIERMMECVDLIKPEALSMALGIVRDKVATLEGNPTSIVAHVDVSVQIAAVNDFIDTLPRVAGEIVPPQTGVRAGLDFAMVDEGRDRADGDEGLDEGKGVGR